MKFSQVFNNRIGIALTTYRPTIYNPPTSWSPSSVFHVHPRSGFWQSSRTFCLSQPCNQSPLFQSYSTEEEKPSTSARLNKIEKKCETLAESHSDAIHFLKSGSTTHIPSDITSSSEVASISSLDGACSLPHPIWSLDCVDSVVVTHFKPRTFSDYLAYFTVKSLRGFFDLISGYSLGRIDERGWLNRIIFLETVAGVPGMVGAMVRHLNSLRRMERDYGWIHTLLEEAENERLHLMTALILKRPSIFFRFVVLVTQGCFLTGFSVAYLVCPKFCHRLVGYLEEEAVKTYTLLLAEMDKGHLPLFKHQPAPKLARDYWQLADDANMRDVFLAIRADESHHREVNHSLANIKENDKNPYRYGSSAH